jgi:uncharacterized LabA/DUF88 family protein
MYRTLRYPPGWPHEPAREKGIDVKIAIDFVRFVMEARFDVIILASHDTDLEPALDMAVDLKRAKIETVAWENCKRIRPQNQRIWHTYLDSAAFVKSRDRTIY